MTPVGDGRGMTRRNLLKTAAVTLGGVGTVTSVAADSGHGRVDRGGEVDSISFDVDEDAAADGVYAEVYEETIDGVVLVSVRGGAVGPGGIGSGFVYEDEYLVTNQHVVGQESTVELQFRDEHWSEASVVGTDVHSDLAVLAVDDRPDASEAIPLADEEPVIGQEVVALGNPLGLDASISQGIVSGVDRSLPSPTGFSIPAAIQTDAAVNPGNSGGPLVTLDGEAVGIVFAGAGPGGSIGFAIAAGLAARVVPALIEDGTYEHAFVGVGVIPVGPTIATANDLPEARGVMVGQVVPDSPADGVLEPAGQEVVDGAPVPVGGDVIIAIDDEPIPTQERLSSYLALETSPGETVSVTIRRDGDEELVELTLDPRPEVDTP